MGCDWNYLIERIRGLDRIDGKHKARLVNSVIILRENLGEDWPVKGGHALLLHLQTIYGNPFDELISALAGCITAMEKVAGVEKIVRRIRQPKEYFGAAAELEVGSLLVRNGCQLTIGPEVGGKKPDFLCQKNGLEFLVEVKGLETSEASREAAVALQRILAACSPIFPAGIILRSLRDPDLAKAERGLKEAASCVTTGSPRQIDIPNDLKLYLVHPDDPDQHGRYDKWCRRQEEQGLIPENSGLVGPPEDLTDLLRIERKINRVTMKRQLPKDMVGVLVITGRFIISDTDVKMVVDALVESLRNSVQITAVVLIAAKTATVSPVEPRIYEDDRYIDIDYRLALFLRERVLIIKNSFCRFPFDYDILQQMFAEPNSKTPDFELKRS